jgi:hypothetical protein
MSSGYAFNACARVGVLAEAIRSEELTIERALRKYAEAATADLLALTRSALHHLLEGTDRRDDEFLVELDVFDLEFNASVQMDGDGILVKISLGAMMAIDDASSIITRLTFPQEAATWDYVAAQYLIEPKLLDYGFILRDVLPGDGRNMIYCYPFAPESEESFEYQVQLANFAVLWVLLHEIGHAQLGHLESPGGTGNYAVLDERAGHSSEVTPDIDPLTQSDATALRTCQEFAADTYATRKLIATFLRNDAIEKVLPRRLTSAAQALYFLLSAAQLPSCIIHRAQASASAGGMRAIGPYPEPAVRTFNVYAALFPAINDSQQFQQRVAGLTGQPNLACNISDRELLAVTTLHTELLDRFFSYIAAVPFLPWHIQGDMIELSGGSQRRITYRLPPEGVDLINRAEAEFVAAALTACRASARFARQGRLMEIFSRWLSIVESSQRIWRDELDRYESRAREGLAQLPGFDLQAYQVLALLREIVLSSQEAGSEADVSEEFNAVVSHVEAIRVTIPRSMPREWS